MPTEKMILAASSTLMRSGITFWRGIKQVMPEGGSRPCGMNTLIRLLSRTPVLMAAAASPVMKASDQMPSDGN
jgi:hypothetical protein